MVMVIQLTLTYRRRTDKAIRWLLRWAIATLLLYGGHFVYFNHYTNLLPFSDTIYVTVNLLVYPLFLLYISAITDRTPLSQQKRFLWSVFLPPITAGLVVGGLYGAMDAGEAKTFITNYLYHGYETKLSGLALLQAWAHIVCHAIFAIQVVVVIVKGFRRIRRFNKTVQQLYADTENKEIQEIPTILILFIITSLVSTIVNVLGRQIFVDSIIISLPSLAFSALIFALAWVGMQQDFTMQDIPEEQEKETDETENVAAVTPSEHNIQIYEKLESMMNEQQTYLNHDLLLNDVAKMLGTNRTYLLQALSSCAHMTFKEYINRKRIAHAEQLIAQNPLTPKTEIATLSGYNSMSSFYRNFAIYHS
jgi:AraC-like DNA-binding protein